MDRDFSAVLCHYIIPSTKCEKCFHIIDTYMHKHFKSNRYIPRSYYNPSMKKQSISLCIRSSNVCLLVAVYVSNIF